MMRFFNQVNDPGDRRVGTGSSRPDRQGPSPFTMPERTSFPASTRAGNRFAGDCGLVQRRHATQDNAVDRNAFSGQDIDDLIYRDLFDRNRFNSAHFE